MRKVWWPNPTEKSAEAPNIISHFGLLKSMWVVFKLLFALGRTEIILHLSKAAYKPVVVKIRKTLSTTPPMLMAIFDFSWKRFALAKDTIYVLPSENFSLHLVEQK